MKMDKIGSKINNFVENIQHKDMQYSLRKEHDYKEFYKQRGQP